MRFSEFLALGYFGLFALVALLAAARRQAAWRSFAWAGLGAALVGSAPRLPFVYIFDCAFDLRDWLLLLTLPLAYWTPAALAGHPNERLEAWLWRIDARLGLTRRRRSALDPFELAYLLVYPMVPAGLIAAMSAPAAVPAETFWRAMLAAVLPCYGLLPLLPTRPPRALELPPSSTPASMGIRRANVGFLAVFGNVWNTLPSGHTAGAAAIAVVVWRSGSPVAPLFVLLAIGIAVGTVRGRYHYAVDTVLGVLLGLAAGLAAASP